MNLDEILEQYKTMMLWHKYIIILAAVLLAAMVGAVVWGIFTAELRILLIITGVVFGACGVALYLIVHRLYIKTGTALAAYLRALEKSDAEIEEIVRDNGIALPGFSGVKKDKEVSS